MAGRIVAVCYGGGIASNPESDDIIDMPVKCQMSEFVSEIEACAFTICLGC